MRQLKDCVEIIHNVSAGKIICLVEDETIAVAKINKSADGDIAIRFDKILVRNYDLEIKQAIQEWAQATFFGTKFTILVDKNIQTKSHTLLAESQYVRGIEDGKNEIIAANREIYRRIASRVETMLDMIQSILDESTRSRLEKEVKEVREIIHAELFSSLTDPLTNLFKKEVFDRIVGSRAEDTEIAITTDTKTIKLEKINTGDSIYMVDLNNFKSLNDGVGHDAGDRVLEFVGKTLARNFKTAKCFRVGGDEFAIVNSKSEKNIDNALSEFFSENLPKLISQANLYDESLMQGKIITGSVGKIEFTKGMRLGELKNSLSRNMEIQKLKDKISTGNLYDRTGKKIQVNIDLYNEVLSCLQHMSRSQTIATLQKLVQGDDEFVRQAINLSHKPQKIQPV